MITVTSAHVDYVSADSKFMKSGGAVICKSHGAIKFMNQNEADKFMSDFNALMKKYAESEVK